MVLVSGQAQVVKFSEPGTNYTTQSIKVVSNNEIIVSAIINDSSEVTMLDSNGTIIWSKRFDAGSGIDLITDIEIDANNNIVVAGLYNATTVQNSDGFILSIDQSTLTLNWFQHMSLLSSNQDIHPFALYPKSNGNILVGGALRHGSVDAFLIEINGTTGIEIWETLTTSGSSSSIRNFQLINNELWLSGRFSTTSSPNSFRPARLRIDSTNGTINSSSFMISAPGTNKRLYTRGAITYNNKAINLLDDEYEKIRRSRAGRYPGRNFGDNADCRAVAGAGKRACGHCL